MRRQTGATRAIAFDHNLRAKARKQAGGAASMLKGPGASAVQAPLIAWLGLRLRLRLRLR